MKNSNLLKPILIILLAVISFSVYFNSLGGDFLIDDDKAILVDTRGHNLKTFFAKYFVFRPGILWEASQAVIWHFFGSNAFYYHLFNVLFHAGCVILLFLLCNIIFSDIRLSFLSALIFSLHPINAEAISWISGGHYVLSSFFFLAALIFYVKSDSSFINLLLSVIFLVISVLSGNNGVMLPFFFLAYDLFFRAKEGQDKRLSRVRVIFLASTFALCALFMFFFFLTRNKYMHSIFYFKGFSYLIVIAKAFIYYLKILYLPLVRGLYHPFVFDTMNIQSLSPAFFSAIAVVIASVFFIVRFRKRFRAVAFGITLFLVAYLPYSNIIPICNIISERYMYLSCMGFSIIMAALFLKAWEIINHSVRQVKLFRLIAIACLSAYLGSYAALTIKRNYEFNNIIIYWDSNVRNFHNGFIVYNNLAGTFCAMGNYDAALAYCWINLMINPKQPHVWCNLGLLYRKKKDFLEAKNSYEEALKLNKGYWPARLGLMEIKKEAGGEAK